MTDCHSQSTNKFVLFFCAGVSALVSRLNCSSSASDAGSQESPEPPEGCSGEEHRQEKNFPWLNGFSRQCRSSIGSKSMKQLDDLLATYLGFVEF